MTGDLFSLSGRVALVTGGSRGIGRMIAEGLLEAGCRAVHITGRNPDVLADTARELGGQCVPLPQDISTVAGCRPLAASYGEREAGLDILVNNAGADWQEEFEDFSEEGWDLVMDLNLKSPFFLTQAMRPALVAAGRSGRPSKVINIASVDAFRLNRAEAYSYHASKSGLVHLTRRIAARLIREGIVVTGIAPGAFATEMNPPALHEEAEVAARTPAGRVGRAADMQGAVVYLASRAGDWVVGETIVVDGGLTLAAIGA